MLSSVDFPEPDGPVIATRLAVVDPQVDVAQGDHVARPARR